MAAAAVTARYSNRLAVLMCMSTVSSIMSLGPWAAIRYRVARSPYQRLDDTTNVHYVVLMAFVILSGRWQQCVAANVAQAAQATVVLMTCDSL